MELKKLRELQRKIVDYRKMFQERISKDGKLIPEKFLSTDVACYKLLNHWYKEMLEGYGDYERIEGLIAEIEEYIFFIDYWRDRDIQEDIDTYEVMHSERSILLWKAVFEGYVAGTTFERACLIICLVALVEEPDSFSDYTLEDFYEPFNMAYAVVCANQLIEKNGMPQELMDYIVESKAYLDFFNVI